MKLNGKDFYCPNSGVCTCAATGRKKPTKECAGIAKGQKKK
jgi:hypothetical protein